MAAKLQQPTDYHTIELHPLSMEVIGRFNQNRGEELNLETLRSLHAAAWNKMIKINDFFNLKKIQADLLCHESTENYNLIYFDAFAPEKQEELWSEDIFERLHHALEIGGILTTYCVKGVIKRRLKKIGFAIEKLAGPIGGKREMLRAIKV